MRTVPDLLARHGDAWAGMDDAVGDVAPALALWEADVHERGLGEMPFPPDYPKMPGEPPRVQPSRAKRGPVEIPNRARWRHGVGLAASMI